MGHHVEQWGLVIKVKHGDTLRRIGAQFCGKLMDNNMNKLRAKIYSLFKFNRDSDLILTYADVDGDIVALGDDDELFDAVICQHLNPLRITAELKPKPGISSTNVQLEPVWMMDPLMTALFNVFDVLEEAISNSTASEVIKSKPFKKVLDNIHKDVKEATSSSLALLNLVDQLSKVARDTGAEMKNKWEKQVEELTWRLQLEKSTRTDMEEAKSQENAKLKVELQNMQQEITKTKALLIKEKEISEKVSEEARMLKEVPLFYTELKDKLTAENNKREELVSSLQKKADENEKNLVDQLSKVARDTGAEMKNKLEKQVEELTWRLQLEKSTRTDMEEAKSQENAKLKVELQNTQQEITKTKALLMKEKEISKKELVGSLEKKVDETEKKFEETSRISEERLKQAECQIIHMSDSMKRLLDKVSYSEAENQVLRQPSLLSSSVTSERLSNPNPTTQTLQKGQHDNEDPKVKPEKVNISGKWKNDANNSSSVSSSNNLPITVPSICATNDPLSGSNIKENCFGEQPIIRNEMVKSIKVDSEILAQNRGNAMLRYRGVRIRRRTAGMRSINAMNQERQKLILGRE